MKQPFYFSKDFIYDKWDIACPILYLRDNISLYLQPLLWFIKVF